MNIRTALLTEHSKSQVLKIVKYIGNDRTRFDTLMQLFLNDEYRVCQRAAWAVSVCAETHPEWMRSYIPVMLDNLNKKVHPAVIRNTIRLLQFTDIPKKEHGRVADICFRYLADPGTPVAIRVFSMTVLSSLSEVYPEIKNELKLIIEEQLPYATPAFKSRLKQIKL